MRSACATCPCPPKEGGYFRTGSRTPMQWDGTANHGFSTAAADALYLPVDTADDAPTVEAQQADPNSLLHAVKSLLAFRHAYRDLDSDASFKVLYAPKAKGDYRRLPGSAASWSAPSIPPGPPPTCR